MDFAFATSYAGKDAIEYVSKRLNRIKNLKTSVYPVKSNYWGQNITVAGLITSQDLINTIKDIKSDYIVVPGVMLKPYTDSFLDGETLSHVEQITGKKFIVIHNHPSKMKKKPITAWQSMDC